MKYRIQQCTTALALWTMVFTAQLAAAEFKYLEAVPDIVALLPPPPEPGSAEAIADADEAYRVYSARTPEQFALGKDQNKLTIFHFAPAIGPWFRAGIAPKLEALFKQVESEAKTATDIGKHGFKRARPCKAEPARFADPVEPNDVGAYSYPSGHATRGILYALVLSEIFPDRREALLVKGREAGWLRVQGGMHYPTDIYAGRVWGQALARAFLSNARFRRDLTEAKAELMSAQKASATVGGH